MIHQDAVGLGSSDGELNGDVSCQSDEGKMNIFKSALLAGAALVLMASGASALTISGGSASLSNTLTDFKNQALGTLNLFDSNLGTLTSLTFTTSYGFQSTITVSATTASSGDVATVSAANFQSTTASVNAVLNSIVNTIARAVVGAQSLSPATYRVTGDDNGYDVAAGTTTQFASNYADQTRTLSTTSASYLAPFSVAGGGTFAVFGNTLTGTTGTQTGGNASMSQVTFADEAISLVYNYTAVTVPEPASLALLGAGLLGVGILRRKAS